MRERERGGGVGGNGGGSMGAGGGGVLGERFLNFIVRSSHPRHNRSPHSAGGIKPLCHMERRRKYVRKKVERQAATVQMPVQMGNSVTDKQRETCQTADWTEFETVQGT